MCGAWVCCPSGRCCASSPPGMEHASFPGRQSYLLPTGQGQACSISQGALWTLLRSWRRSPISKGYHVWPCLQGDIAHGAFLGAKTPPSQAAAQWVKQRQEATLASLCSVLVLNKGSTREERAGVTCCLSNGTLLTVGATEGAGKLGAGVREKTRSSQVLTSQRCLALHAGDKERKSHHS